MRSNRSLRLRFSRIGSIALAVCVIVLLFGFVALPQQPDGAVAGTVIDMRTQGPFAGVLVLIQGVGQATTDKDGRFTISGVRPGKHPIQALRTGMAAPLRDRGSGTVTVRPAEDV